ADPPRSPLCKPAAVANSRPVARGRSSAAGLSSRTRAVHRRSELLNEMEHPPVERHRTHQRLASRLGCWDPSTKTASMRLESGSDHIAHIATGRRDYPK